MTLCDCDQAPRPSIHSNSVIHVAARVVLRISRQLHFAESKCECQRPSCRSSLPSLSDVTQTSCDHHSVLALQENRPMPQGRRLTVRSSWRLGFDAGGGIMSQGDLSVQGGSTVSPSVCRGLVGPWRITVYDCMSVIVLACPTCDLEQERSSTGSQLADRSECRLQSALRSVMKSQSCPWRSRPGAGRTR